MAPTRSWDETAPAGSSAIASGDDAIRNMKVDIRQRMDATHWFSEEDAATKVWRWRGAHRAGFVHVTKQHGSTTAMKAWCNTHYGSTAADWAQYYSCQHLVNADGTASQNGLYRIHGSGYAIQMASYPSSPNQVSP